MGKPFIADIHQFLSTFLLPVSLTEAHEFLELVDSSCQYLALYQRYFPKAFEQALELYGEQGVLPLPGDPYSILEWQFLHLVNTHLFPIPYWVFDDPVAENRSYCIPVEPLGLPEINEYGDTWSIADEMDLGWQLLLYLGGDLPADFFTGRFEQGDPDAAIFDLHIEQGQVSDAVLRARCAEQQEPLAFLYQAVSVRDHDTGTAWLDATAEMAVEDAYWNEEVVDELTRQFVESQEILDQVMQFIRWLEADVYGHFQEVTDLWNRCIKETNEQIKRQWKKG